VGHASFSRILLVSKHKIPNAKFSFADGLTQLISSVTCSYHIDKLRPRLSPFGLLIRTVIDHGYMLLREP
jgi:hypothetical protein